MCDIDTVQTACCGKLVEIHLGIDLDRDPVVSTRNREVAVFCVEHADPKFSERMTRWVGGEQGDYEFVALTENAWRNRHHNHPNDSGTDEVKPEAPK